MIHIRPSDGPALRSAWRLEARVVDSLPPLAWVARLRSHVAEVRCGRSVRLEPDHVVEGTWAGQPGARGLLDSTTVFGSALIANGGRLILVPPAHSMEGLYLAARDDGLYASNSFPGLLAATRSELLRGAPYVEAFRSSGLGLEAMPVSLPTSRGPVEFWYYENITVGADGRPVAMPKRREQPFTSYADYIARWRAALVSLLANAPGYRPAVALSSGYDSTAVAALAAREGLGRALSFATGKPADGAPAPDDSGRAAARTLGLEHVVVDRLAYLAREDHPEAEFLATGMTGEDVVFTAMEGELRRTLLMTGHFGDGMWRRHRPSRPPLHRYDYSGASLGEFRLRVDFIHAIVPSFGNLGTRESLKAISETAEMRPYMVGGKYDRPIARRLIEETGVPRGAFAVSKRAASGSIHRDGFASLSAATAEAIRARAAAEGVELRFGRRRLRRGHRALVKLAEKVHLEKLTAPILRRRRESTHFDPATGSLLLRWGVERVLPRYAGIAGWPKL
jgi:hypothetical protein